MNFLLEKTFLGILWLGLYCGCAKELSELKPFPCANDATCPSGMLCIDKQCIVPCEGSCGTKESCAVFSNGSACMPSCTPFESCPDNDATQTCRLLQGFIEGEKEVVPVFSCTSKGDKPAGAVCNDDPYLCAGNSVCWKTFKDTNYLCRAMCSKAPNSTHTCTQLGTTCKPVGYVDDSYIGVCLP